MHKHSVIPLVGVAGTQLTKHSVKENLLDSNIQFETLKRYYEEFKPDGVFTFMDLTVEAEALGLEIKMPDDDTPSVLEHSVKNSEQLEKFKSNYKGISGRMPLFIDLVKKLNENFDTSIGAYVIGPFTLAGELNGVNDLLINTIMNPELVVEMLNFSIDVISDYANELYKAGADTVCILEPTAAMLAPEQYEEFSLVQFKKIHENVGKKPLMLHICGNTNHLIEGMSKSGACGLSLDSAVDMANAIDTIPSDMKLIGNLDTVEVFLNGDIDLVSGEAEKLLKVMENHPNFVLSSGCDLPLATPFENIRALIEAVRK